MGATRPGTAAVPSSGGECSPEKGERVRYGVGGAARLSRGLWEAALTGGGGDGRGRQTVKADSANLLDVAGRKGYAGAQVAARGGQHCGLLLHELGTEMV